MVFIVADFLHHKSSIFLKFCPICFTIFTYNFDNFYYSGWQVRRTHNRYPGDPDLDPGGGDPVRGVPGPPGEGDPLPHTPHRQDPGQAGG